MNGPVDPATWSTVPKLSPLMGDERFTGLDASVLDFWRFALSDLRTNNTRGHLAEFLVARALGVTAERVEWDDYDVLWQDVKIEVKSSAYLQAWPQRAPSQIRFTNLQSRAWGDITAGLSSEKTYKADIYVFCVHTIQQHDAYDPLDVNAWAFYILPRAVLGELSVQSLGLATVARLTTAVHYPQLADAILAHVSAPHAQYWRRTGAAVRYFKLVGHRDYILKDDAWVRYDLYKSGPSWWRLTGEIDTDIITEDELPPSAPR